MPAYNIWSENKPPRETLVMARWRALGMNGERWTLVRTCARGCCVFPVPNDGMGSMVLPRYWREPTPDELKTHDIKQKA